MPCAVLLCLLVTFASHAADATQPREVAKDVLQLGQIQHPAITESSGVALSRKDTNVLWTHNDGGGRKHALYAMTRDGKPLAEFRVSGVLMQDWEDIAADNHGHLFLGDIGNNDRKRTEIAVHQVDEPDLKQARGIVDVTRSWTLRYPQKPFDCESLFVWGDFGYVISKVFDDARAELFRFSLTNNQPQTLEHVAQLKIDSPVTGADISPDGKLLAVIAKNGAYAFRINGNPANVNDSKSNYARFKHEHIEACTFVPEGLLVTAESREIYLFTDDDFRRKKKKAAPEHE
jgi:hypothetical protein